MRKLCYGAVLVTALFTGWRQSSPAPDAGLAERVRLACGLAKEKEEALANLLIAQKGQASDLSIRQQGEAGDAEILCQKGALMVPGKSGPCFDMAKAFGGVF